MALAERADATSLKSDAVESDICWLVYTGGTTGRPKGVMATHRVLTSMALTALAEYELPREVRYLAASWPAQPLSVCQTTSGAKRSPPWWSPARARRCRPTS
jgi:acyl-CoA synthetase (AMP-forming)/AMP-acid ligase II